MVETKFKHTDIGLIPEDWVVINLQDNCTLKARPGWQALDYFGHNIMDITKK